MLQLTDTQKAFVKDHKWSLLMHLHGATEGILWHQCEALKMSRIIRTPKVKGRWGLGVTTYLRDDDETEYPTLPDCLIAMGIE